MIRSILALKLEREFDKAVRSSKNLMHYHPLGVVYDDLRATFGFRFTAIGSIVFETNMSDSEYMLRPKMRQLKTRHPKPWSDIRRDNIFQRHYHFALNQTALMEARLKLYKMVQKMTEKEKAMLEHEAKLMRISISYDEMDMDDVNELIQNIRRKKRSLKK